MPKPTLAIVIVNWNTGVLLRECIASLEASIQDLDAIGRLTQIVVVDNASRDGSADDLSLPGRKLLVINNTENRGFAAACNQGAAACSSEYILFLNPDTRLFEKSLSVPVMWMQAATQVEVGIVGIQLLDDSGEVSSTISHFPHPLRFLAHALGLNRAFPALAHALPPTEHQSSRAAEQVMGAFFLVRRSLFELLGGFDERFFVYFEEVDFSYRAHQLGWRSCFLADAQAYHKGCGTSSQVKAKRLFYSLRSRLLYAQKHFSRPSVAATFAVTLAVEPFARAFQLIVGGRTSELKDLLIAYNYLVRDSSIRAPEYRWR